MLNLIIATLISMGFNISGEHFIMNNGNADIIKHERLYNESGGDEYFKAYVTIDPRLLDDVVITDSVDPVKEQ
jgi:hypothetical protein